MCQFVAYYHVACQHTDIQPAQMCGAAKTELARINEQINSAASGVPFSPAPCCVPRFHRPGVQSNIVQYYVVQPDQVSPIVLAKNDRVELLRQKARIALRGQVGPHAQTGVYGQVGPQSHIQMGVHGQAVPYEQCYHQTSSWVAGRQQPQQLQFQMTPPPPPFDDPRPPSPPIAGLCLGCTQSVETLERIQQTQPNFGLTEEEVMGPETWRFVVESYQKAHELVNNWTECMNALNPLNSRFASVDCPGFPFHLALPPYSGHPDISTEPMVEELNKEIMMRKVNSMIMQNNDEITAIKNRFAEEGSAYYENNPNRFVSHAPAEDPFIDDQPLGDVPEVPHPLLGNRPRHEILVMPKPRVSKAVRDYIGIRETANRKSPTPNARYMQGTSILEAHMAASMDVDDGTDTDRFAFTDRGDDTETEVSTDIDDDMDDGDTVVYPESITTDRGPMVMSGTPALTIDNTPSRATNTSISTPSTAPRSRKRVRIVETPTLSERWRAALRPRRPMRSESMDGLYLD